MKGLSGLANVGHFGTDLAKGIGTELDTQEKEAQLKAFGEEFAKYIQEKNPKKGETKDLGTDALAPKVEEAPVKEELKTETPDAIKTETKIIEPKSREDFMQDLSTGKQEADKPMAIKPNIQESAKAAVDKTAEIKEKKGDAKIMALGKVVDIASQYTPIEARYGVPESVKGVVAEKVKTREDDIAELEADNAKIVELLAKYPKAGEHPALKQISEAMKDKYYLAKYGSLTAGTESKDQKNAIEIENLKWADVAKELELEGKVSAAAEMWSKVYKNMLDADTRAKGGGRIGLPLQAMSEELQDYWANEIAAGRADMSQVLPIAKGYRADINSVSNIFRKAQEMMKGGAGGGGNIADRMKEFKYYTSPQLTRQESAAATVENTLPLLEEAVKNYSAKDFRAGNVFLQRLGQQVSNPELAALNVLRSTVAIEVVKYLSNNGVTADTDRKHWLELVDTAQSPEAMGSIINTLKSEMAARKKGIAGSTGAYGKDTAKSKLDAILGEQK